MPEVRFGKKKSVAIYSKKKHQAHTFILQAWSLVEKTVIFSLKKSHLSTTPSKNAVIFIVKKSSRFTLIYNPILALTFVTVYWIVGLFRAYSD